MSRSLGGWTRTLANWMRASWPTTHEPLDLPTVTIGPLMSDDDVDFHSAMLELHTILADVHDTCIDSGEKLYDWVNLVDAHRFGLDWREQWPEDEAALMLARWREQRAVVAA